MKFLPPFVYCLTLLANSTLHAAQKRISMETYLTEENKKIFLNQIKNISEKGDNAYKEQDYKEAYKLYKKARDKSLKYYGGKSEYTAESYTKFAAVCNKQGKYSEALIYLKKANTIFKRKKKQRNSIFYYKLATAHNKQKNYEKAIKFYKKALKAQRIVDKPHPELSTIYTELAKCYQNRKEHKKALKYYLLALPLHSTKAKKTKNYTPLAKSHMEIANMYTMLLKKEKAIEHYTKAMEILSKKSPDHLDLLTIYSQLGALYKQTKKYTKAVTYLKKALEQDPNKNAKNIEIAQRNDTIAWLYRRIKSKKQAIKHYEKAFTIYAFIEESDTCLVAKSHHNLSCVYIDDNQNNKAIEHAKKALDIYKEKKKSIEQASCYHNLGIATRQLITSKKEMNYEDAIKYQKNELDIYLSEYKKKVLSLKDEKKKLSLKEEKKALSLKDKKKKLPLKEEKKALSLKDKKKKLPLKEEKKELPLKDEKKELLLKIAICCYQRGLTRQAAGRYKDAIKDHMRVSGIYSDETNNASPSAIALNLYHLGLSYYYNKKYEEAKNSFEKALEIRRKIEEQTPTQKNSNRIADICRSLGDVHCTLDKYEEAKERYQESLTIRSTNNYSLLDIAKSHENLGLVCYYNNEEKEAIEHHQEAIELRESNKGKKSDIAQGYRNLGLAFYYDEQYKEAIERYRKTSNMYEKDLNVEEVEIADINRYLGNAYLESAISLSKTSDQKKDMNDAYKQAKICYKKAISIYKEEETEKRDECRKNLALIPHTATQISPPLNVYHTPITSQNKLSISV